MEEAVQPKEVLVYPLSKGKRILSYLADFFLCYILTFSLFYLGIYPLGKVIGHADELTSLAETKSKQRDSVLYGNKLLFSKLGSQEPSSFTDNLSYTYDCFLSYYVVPGEENSSYEVFRTYAVSLHQDESLYDSFFSLYDAEGKWFSKTSGTWMLLDSYKTEFSPYFDPKDELSPQGKTDYESLRDSFFLPCYSHMVKDIEEKGLSYQEYEFSSLQKEISSIYHQQDMILVWSSLASEAVSLLLLYLLLPLLDHNRRSLATLLLHEERISLPSYKTLSRGRAALRLPYFLLTDSWLCFLTPILYTGANSLFALPVLLPISLISFLYVLASLVFLLINKKNQTLTDFLSSSVLIPSSSLEAIDAARGYRA